MSPKAFDATGGLRKNYPTTDPELAYLADPEEVELLRIWEESGYDPATYRAALVREGRHIPARPIPDPVDDSQFPIRMP